MVYSCEFEIKILSEEWEFGRVEMMKDRDQGRIVARPPLD